MYRIFAAAFIMVTALSGCTSPPLTDVELADARKPAPAPAQPNTPGFFGHVPLMPDFTKNVGDRVFFDVDSTILTADAQATLQHQAAWLKNFKSPIEVEGHADERGTREYNLALGARRANAVRNYLIAQGVPADLLTIISYGKERPAVLGDNENAWAQNRRAVSVPQNVPHS